MMRRLQYLVESNRLGRIMVPKVRLTEELVGEYQKQLCTGLYLNEAFGCATVDIREVKPFSPLVLLSLVQLESVEGWMEVNLSGLKYLSVGNVKRIDFERLPDLEMLGLTWNNTVQGFQFLNGLSLLSIRNCHQDQVDQMSAMKHLADLTISDGMVNDIGPLHSCDNLTRLRIVKCPKLQAIGPLPTALKISSVDIESCNGLRDVDGLGDLQELTELTLIGSRPLRSISCLSNCHKLQRLVLQIPIEDGDVGFLKRMESLVSLSCYPRANHNADVRSFPAFNRPWLQSEGLWPSWSVGLLNEVRAKATDLASQRPSF